MEFGKAEILEIGKAVDLVAQCEGAMFQILFLVNKSLKVEICC